MHRVLQQSQAKALAMGVFGNRKKKSAAAAAAAPPPPAAAHNTMLPAPPAAATAVTPPCFLQANERYIHVCLNKKSLRA